jgi:uncharacterized protein (UPF0305 family)
VGRWVGGLCVDENVNAAALVPQRQRNTAVAAGVLHILERLDDVRNAGSAQEAAEDEGPEAANKCKVNIHSMQSQCANLKNAGRVM